jgi:hypothetical protein
MSDLHINSFKSVRIEGLAIDTKASLGFATGYLISYLGRKYLVSNWHVFTGRNFQTREIIHPSGTNPGYFNLTFFIAKDKTTKSIMPINCSIEKLSLYERDISFTDEIIYDYNKPLWLEHKTKKDIDVSLIDITDFLPIDDGIDIQFFDLEKELQKSDVNLSVMDDVFIIGYPLSSSTTPNDFPIYKNATIATEPKFFRQLPIFYIDGKTKKGMSGSPVIKKQPIKVVNDDNKISISEGRIDLIGTYSGRERQEKDLYEAELGIVWNLKETILEILQRK